MAKKKKDVLNQVLGIASNISEVTKFIPDAEQAYNITKDVASSSKNAIVINSNKDKIRKLVIEIGERIYKNNIEVNDKNVKAEVECIKELMNERPK